MPQELDPLPDTPAHVASLLRWWLESGVTDVLAEAPRSWLSQPAVAATTPAPSPAADAPVPKALLAPAAAQNAGPALAGIDSLADLEAAVRGFDACALKATATSTVFCDGDSASRVMLIGEAPGADEDRIGKPFVGQAGQLLDRMMAAIGRARTHPAPEAFYITNMLYWRPPGNRTPTPQEIQLCLPFVLRHIQLVDPLVIFTLGAVPFQGLVNTNEGITRARGVWRTLEVGGKSYPLLPTLHPAFLLRQPGQKANAWRDLLSLQRFLESGLQ